MLGADSDKWVQLVPWMLAFETEFLLLLSPPKVSGPWFLLEFSLFDFSTVVDCWPSELRVGSCLAWSHLLTLAIAFWYGQLLEFHLLPVSSWGYTYLVHLLTLFLGPSSNTAEWGWRVYLTGIFNTSVQYVHLGSYLLSCGAQIHSSQWELSNFILLDVTHLSLKFFNLIYHLLNSWSQILMSFTLYIYLNQQEKLYLGWF